MLQKYAWLVLVIFVFSCSTPSTGINMKLMDTSVRPQDDFYDYANGTWLKTTEIPDDKAAYGTFYELWDKNEEQLKTLVEQASKNNQVMGSNDQKVGDFYLSFLNEEQIEKQGLKPVENYLKKIQSMQNQNDLLKIMIALYKRGTLIPFNIGVDINSDNTNEYICHVWQSGTHLPDRDYYLKDDERFKDIRKKYTDFIEKILTLGGQTLAEEKAKRILAMETEFAKIQWTEVQNRDRDKTYNHYPLEKLQKFTPNFNWTLVVHESNMTKSPGFIVMQPSFFEGLSKLFTRFSLEDWKTYLTWSHLDSAAPYLSKDFVQTHFDFYSTTLRGIPKMRPRWKRAIDNINSHMGEILGKIYVEKYFKPAAKARVLELVENLRLVFRERIQKLDWMGSITKKEALIKLEKFTAKIGYPNKWRDYSGLNIHKENLYENIIAASLFNYNFDANKLGKPVDREEWFVPPQIINAFYHSDMNQIVFPAAILQPPFFDPQADDAYNYGAIGTVIGHEFSHGFDDQGRKSDGDGNLRDWWTEEDAQRFQKRTDVMVKQYSEYEPLEGFKVNGELTLGENIGDLAGVTVALHALKLALKDKEPLKMNGLTPTQRFFMAFAQIWKSIYRDEALRQRLLTDPHSPSRYRVIGVLSNMPEFYETFGVKSGDPMYREAKERVKIW